MKAYEAIISQAQAYFRRFQAQNEMRTMKRNQALRMKVREEILKTETDYVRYMNEAVQKFRPYIQQLTEQEEIEKDSVTVIFSNIDEVRKFSASFLESLKKSVSGVPPNGCWVSVFKRLNDGYDAYMRYLTDYGLSVERVNQLLYMEKVRRELDRLKGSDKDISSYLIMPVQRLPRYVLLLTELQKHTLPCHPDYKNLEDMIELVKHITSQINTYKSQRDAQRKKDTIESLIDIGKFDVKGEVVRCRRHFTDAIQSTPIDVYVTENMFIGAECGVAKFAYPIKKVTLLMSNTLPDTFKVHVGSHSKVKLHGTSLVPDGGLIRMIEDMKKANSTEQLSNEPNEEEPAQPTFDPSLKDPEQELMNRRKALGNARLSRYKKRRKPLTGDMVVPYLSKDRLCSDKAKSANPSLLEATSRLTCSADVSPHLSLKGSSQHSSKTQSQRTSLSEPPSPSHNNQETRARLRQRPSPALKGKRPKNSMKFEVYSFAELEAKPQHIPREELIVWTRIRCLTHV